jgi:two-component system LytT family response regulator
MPAVVFVTAYDKYAIQAFEVNVVDYLPKPFDHRRLLARCTAMRTPDRLPDSRQPEYPHSTVRAWLFGLTSDQHGSC